MRLSRFKKSGYGSRFYTSCDPHATLLFLPDPVRDQLKKYLSPPDGYHLLGLDAIEKTDFRYEDGNQILRQIHLIGAYIGQGNLKYSKSSSKILKTSVKEMAAYCHIHEFFIGQNADLEYLNTGLNISFLQNQSIKETQGAPEFLRQVFDCFFADFDPYSGYRLTRLLFHLKGAHHLLDGYYELTHRNNELSVRASLRNLLRALQPGLWYSVQKLLDYCVYREINLGILDKIDPLIPEPALLVFRLKEHPELIELIARDEVLQKYILKAEDHHVLITDKHLYKVKKRLEAFGYFIHQLR
jgi:hypothetical protein